MMRPVPASMIGEPDEPPSLFEVCKRVGASPRKLGYCFQDVLGVSPARYVKTIRLNSARRELSRPRDAAILRYAFFTSSSEQLGSISKIL